MCLCVCACVPQCVYVRVCVCLSVCLSVGRVRGPGRLIHLKLSLFPVAVDILLQPDPGPEWEIREIMRHELRRMTCCATDREINFVRIDSLRQKEETSSQKTDRQTGRLED